MGKDTSSPLADTIAEYIKGEILAGNLRPGDRLPAEVKLAELFNVSRMTVRSGIGKCNALGITESRIGSGTYVRGFNMRNLFQEFQNFDPLSVSPTEVNDFFTALQSASFRMAVSNKTYGQPEIDHICRLEEALAEAFRSCDPELIFPADRAFHRALCKLSKNSLLYSVYDAVEFTLINNIRKRTEYVLRNEGDIDVQIRYHKALADSVKSADTVSFVLQLKAQLGRVNAAQQETAES